AGGREGTPNRGRARARKRRRGRGARGHRRTAGDSGIEGAVGRRHADRGQAMKPLVCLLALSSIAAAQPRQRAVVLATPDVAGFDNAHTVGIQEIVARVREANFDVARARVQASASDRAASSAWAALFPSLGVSAGYGLMDGFAVTPFGFIGAHYYGAVA